MDPFQVDGSFTSLIYSSDLRFSNLILFLNYSKLEADCPWKNRYP